MQMETFIKQYIVERALNNGNVTKYRTPLVGFAAAEAQIFERLPEVTHKGHLQPKDLLPEAKSVIAFFLPFTKDTIQANRKPEVSIEWALAYNETNALLNDICVGLQTLLSEHGYKSSFVQPTNNFDKVKLVSQWSHKHVAYATGLGKFGFNRQLITPVGCAGRFSSIITDAVLEPCVLPENHNYEKCEQCGWCFKSCPIGALKADVWDNQACWNKLQENEKLVGLNMAHSCGKCVIGPCAIY